MCLAAVLRVVVVVTRTDRGSRRSVCVGFVVPEGEKFKWALFFSFFVSVQSSQFWFPSDLLFGGSTLVIRERAQAGSTLFSAAPCCSAILASMLGCLVFTVLAPSQACYAVLSPRTPCLSLGQTIETERVPNNMPRMEPHQKNIQSASSPLRICGPSAAQYTRTQYRCYLINQMIIWERHYRK